MHRILTNPYYKGDVRYKGVTYRGAHEPIVPREVWYQVQAVLDCHKVRRRRNAGARSLLEGHRLLRSVREPADHLQRP